MIQQNYFIYIVKALYFKLKIEKIIFFVVNQIFINNLLVIYRLNLYFYYFSPI